MQTSDQVVVLQGDSTKWYSQAVFILNQSPQADPPPVDFVEEAEKIINDYVARKRKTAKQSIHDYLNYTPPVIVPPKKAPILIESMESNSMEPSNMECKGSLMRRFWETPVFYVVSALACVAMAAIIAFGWFGG